MKNKMRVVATLIGISLLAMSSAVWARDEHKDENGDGYAETHLFYEGSKLLKAEVDLDKDQKPDMWVEYANDKRKSATVDKNHDGKADQWIVYNAKGSSFWKATDSNADGKPDQYMFFPKGGRELVLKEYDKNFDGKIDKRSFSFWDPNKKISYPNGNRMMSTPNPGYRVITSETDADFDGIIDQYLNKEDRKISKLGQAIDGRVTTPPSVNYDDADEEKSDAQPEDMFKARETDRLKQLNDKYGLE